MNIIKMIKDNTHTKEKFMSGLLSNDFCVTKIETNNKYVYDLSFDNSVKIPDLDVFSEMIGILTVYTLLKRISFCDLSIFSKTR